MRTQVLAILGSARGDGHTKAVLDAVCSDRSASRIDLGALDIRSYEYGQPIDRDDFIAVAEAMVAHSRIVFATPVYWYSMSGRMKTLFDRFTDLVTVRKDIGRQLKGRLMFAVSCGSEAQLPDGFEVPFRETAAYLSMSYQGMFYAQTNNLGLLPSALVGAAAFGDRLFAGASEPESTI
jgi:putative NADPH-quinone reductase